MKWFIGIIIILLLVGCAQDTSDASPKVAKDVPQPNAISLNFENQKQLDNFKPIGSWKIRKGKLHGDGLAVLNNFAVKDSTANVIIDGAGGIAFRATSPKSFYVIAFEPRMKLVHLYQYQDGRRKPLAEGFYESGNRLTVDVHSTSVRAYVDDKLVIDANVRVKRGRIGLWGDAVFDDFSAEKI